MKKRRITKFTIETERTFIFRSFGAQQPGWCVRCGADAQMATVSEAAREAGLSELAIHQLFTGRALHFKEDAEGRVLICLKSLFEIDTKGERS